MLVCCFSLRACARNNPTARACFTAIFAIGSAGEVVESIDPLGHHTLISYDALGRTTSVRQVIGQNDLSSSETNDLLTTMQYVTLANGNTQQISTDPLGRVTTTTFDRLGRAIQATDPTGAVTSMSYNAAGQVVCYASEA